MISKEKTNKQTNKEKKQNKTKHNIYNIVLPILTLHHSIMIQIVNTGFVLRQMFLVYRVTDPS